MISPRAIACSGCDRLTSLPQSWGVWRSIFIGDKETPMDAQQLWKAASQYGRTKRHG
jgi:hypothetical protein